MGYVQIKDKRFDSFIQESEINKRAKAMGREITAFFSGHKLLIIGILNGAFMFSAELVKHIELECQVSFLKLASYNGIESSKKVKKLVGLNETVENKTVLVVEDIVDTGLTLDNIVTQLRGQQPASVYVATLLFKPAACHLVQQPDFIGFNIPNDFVVGYGLDYKGYGRNLKHIYKLNNT